MKIGIDIRNFSKKSPQFCSDFLTALQAVNIGNEFCIYADKDFPLPEGMHSTSNEKFSQLWWQETTFLKQLKADKNDTVVTFEDRFPLLYKERVIPVISSLEHIFYPDVEEENSLQKHLRMFYLKHLLKKSHAIITFTTATKKELNERLNIVEDTIQVVRPFFTACPWWTSMLDVKMKLGIKGSYFVYDYPHQHNNNLKRTLETIRELQKKYPLSLVILGNTNSASREARDLVRTMQMDSTVFFVGEPAPAELKNYYTQSIGVIYPIIYDHFPESLHRAFWYNVPILASNNSEIQNVFGESIVYFSPISVGNMIDSFSAYLSQSSYMVNYTAIHQRYHASLFCTALLSLIV